MLDDGVDDKSEFDCALRDEVLILLRLLGIETRSESKRNQDGSICRLQNRKKEIEIPMELEIALLLPEKRT
jgi:hypothetical protein